MSKMQFVAASERAAEEQGGAEEEVLEFSIRGGGDFVATKPTLDQVILLATASDTGSIREMVAASLAFLEGIMPLGDYRRLRRLIAQGTVSNSLLLGGDEANERGIIDWIVEQVTDGRPPQPASDSSPSPKSGGARSTGRAPGKGSIRSDSP